jgi:mediator of RNA polymerase II transcription subunit 17
MEITFMNRQSLVNSQPCRYFLDAPASVQTPSAKLADHLRRIFRERGTDFFQKKSSERAQPDSAESTSDDEPSNEGKGRDAKPMTTDELFKLRAEILPKL